MTSHRGTGDADGTTARAVDLRGPLERWARRSWRAGPDPLLRAAGWLFGGGADLRHFLYETGLLTAAPSPVPVVSIGGLTVGGSGKTPVSAAIARWLREADAAPATITRGYPDELRVHRRLNPDVPAYGSPDRLRAVERAARDGFRAAVLDDGFQHRELRRDLEIVLVDLDLFGDDRLRLPAGPYRDRWAELVRADAVVLTRRCASGRAPSTLADRLRSALPEALVARCALRSGRLVRYREPPSSSSGARPVASAAPPARPAAVLSVMKPGPVLASLRRHGVAPRAILLLPDHGRPPAGAVDELLRDGEERAVVGTLKDVVKLDRTVDERTALWYLEERVEWERGERALRRLVEERGRRS